ncbi:MAG: hypothetical protein A4E63_02060 [Syntrophorhabdus sp. PtaU1.Bin050]|nr:MAG: hypothetical protein A4E63_02060 [Syntrophorhabdus sp. PtaU1.Bin050]
MNFIWDSTNSTVASIFMQEKCCVLRMTENEQSCPVLLMRTAQGYHIFSGIRGLTFSALLPAG